MRRENDPLTDRPDFAGRVKAFPADLVLDPSRKQDSDVHLPFRQRAGLVRTNHGCGTEGFDSRQFRIKACRRIIR